jgi:hypothetical protein
LLYDSCNAQGTKASTATVAVAGRLANTNTACIANAFEQGTLTVGEKLSTFDLLIKVACFLQKMRIMFVPSKAPYLS